MLQALIKSWKKLLDEKDQKEKEEKREERKEGKREERRLERAGVGSGGEQPHSCLIT